MAKKEDIIKGNIEPFEKKPTQSKKFVAYLIAEFTWKIVIGMFLVLYAADLGVMATILGVSLILIAGFVEAGFILGQAALDRFTRMAQITAGQISAVAGKAEEVGEGLVEKAKDVFDGDDEEKDD